MILLNASRLNLIGAKQQTIVMIQRIITKIHCIGRLHGQVKLRCKCRKFQHEKKIDVYLKMATLLVRLVGKSNCLALYMLWCWI